LVYRTLTMIEKYFQGNVPEMGKLDEKGKKIQEKIAIISQEVSKPLSASADFNFSASLESVWELIAMANKYVEETKPWNLAKEDKIDELKSFISLLVAVIRKVADEITPFMPKTAASINQQVGGSIIKKGEPLFPRIER